MSRVREVPGGGIEVGDGELGVAVTYLPEAINVELYFDLSNIYAKLSLDEWREMVAHVNAEIDSALERGLHRGGA